MLRPIQSTSRSRLVFEQLRDGILSGAFQPGQRLPTEREICSQLGVNRTSVREALKRLEQAKLVQVRHGSGTVVLDFRTHAGLELMRDLLMPAGVLNPVALRSVLEVRVLIGPELTRLAAVRADEARLERLSEIVERIEGYSHEQSEALQQADFDFHYAMAEASENLALLLVVNSIRELYFEYRDLFLPAFQAPFPERGKYREIVAALRARRADEAARLDRELLERTNARLGLEPSNGAARVGA